MNADRDHSRTLAEAVYAAATTGAPIALRGGGSKAFYIGAIEGGVLDVATHRGIVSYEPTELVITARAGTRLTEIEAVLADKNQMLAFEPPHFGPEATIGGTIACGFSGPRRPYAGAARDFVLGTRIINGSGALLTFGGQVMKNVAGYDVSRLMTGSLGTLGVLLEVSLKVLPRPATEVTLCFAATMDAAILRMNIWAGKSWPLSAACHFDDTLYTRLSGAEAAVRAAAASLGGEPVADGARFWEALREHRLDFFAAGTPLWRLSVPPATPRLFLPGAWLLDWGGAQRWLKTDAPAAVVHQATEAMGGHARLFRGQPGVAVALHSMAPAFRRLHRRIKHAFDPVGILNVTAFTHITGERRR